MIEASAPARAGIIGNPTDGYGGSMVACSLGLRATVRISDCDRLELAYGGRETTITDEKDLRLDSGVFDIAKSVIRYLRISDRKFRIEGNSDVPFRSGLAGSTAMLAATFGAVASYIGLRLNPYRTAETIRYIELNYMDIQCGYQDQYMSVFGGLNYMDFRTKEIYRELHEEVFATVEPLAGYVEKLPFVLVHTGVQRISGSVLRPVRERWLDGDPEVVEGYREIAELARLGKKALIDGDWESLGELMNRNHEIQKALGASGKVNDMFIDMALAHGALGAKLAGAGGGGTILALHPEPDKMIEAFKNKGDYRVILLDPGPGLQVGEIPTS
jgi:galactokinase/mevalonate kinase-like predicted kinase